MRYGLKEHTIESICGVLALHPNVEKAVLYGSRAKGNYKHGSDIDLTLCGDALTSQELGAIIEELDDLLLPYKIDLSIFEQLDHAKLREHIERVGVVFHQRLTTVRKTGWHKTTLGEACATATGNTPPKNNTDFYGQFIPLVKPPELCNATLDSAEDGLSESGTKVAFNQQINAILPDVKKAIPEFMFYQVLSCSFKEQLEALASGTTAPIVNKSKFDSITIALPPLPEQQRIVTILDEAFDSIATAKANTEKNLQNARALFESYLQSVFADAWETGELVTLTDLATDITDGDHMPPPKASSGVPFITIGNVAKDTRTIDFSDTFMVSKDNFDRLKYHKKPMKGDVLYTVTGSFGIPVPISEHREFCFQRHMGLVRPKPEVCSEWLYYLLMSPQVLKQANDGATGTAQKTVSLQLLRGFQVPNVPFERQQPVVTKLNALAEETQRLESIYRQKLTALDALKKSLLDQAFTGIV